jgi:hypothetical protein
MCASQWERWRGAACWLRVLRLLPAWPAGVVLWLKVAVWLMAQRTVLLLMVR